MKNRYLIITLLTSFFLVGCHKDDNLNTEPKITKETVDVLATQATFKWTVDWLGKFSSVVEVSENADMSASRYYGSEAETENHDFTAMATGLKELTMYYYRYVVWNPNYVNNKFLTEVNSFKMCGGVIESLFSVSANEQVYFSNGNLQYQASTGTWRFADNQYDYIGESNSNISSSYSGWIDLFGWGTSGWNSGANCYQPWSMSTSYSDYYPGGSYTNSLTGSYANADWGVYNAISNGGDQAGLWRTLTYDEWAYVRNTRSTSSGIRYAMACVNSQNGMIILPDDWSVSYYSLNSTNNSSASCTSNIITATQWAALEQHGAVFLPAAGDRKGTSIKCVGSFGCYWLSSNHYGDAWLADFVYFSYSGSDGVDEALISRDNGRSVRLVRDAR